VTQEAAIRRIRVRSQPGKIVPGDPILKKPNTKRVGGVAQGESPEFKSQCHKNDTIFYAILRIYEILHILKNDSQILASMTKIIK
jgi:hypothetical protein